MLTSYNISKRGAGSRLMLGLVQVTLSIFTFYFITSMITSVLLMLIAPLIFSVLIPIVTAIFFSRGLRAKLGGFWTFKQALLGIFVMFFVCSIVNTVGNDLLFGKLVEPNRNAKLQTAIFGATALTMKKSGASQAQIDQKTTELDKQFHFKKDESAASLVSGLIGSASGGFVLSLIFAAIFKKERPFFAAADVGNSPDPAI